MFSAFKQNSKKPFNHFSYNNNSEILRTGPLKGATAVTFDKSQKIKTKKRKSTEKTVPVHKKKKETKSEETKEKKKKKEQKDAF